MAYARQGVLRSFLWPFIITLNCNWNVIMIHLITINLTVEKAVIWLEQELAQRGVETRRSFDLRSSRALAAGCLCPHHDTAVCDCQMIVLLLYGLTPYLVPIVMHSYEGQTWLTVTDNAALTRIRQVLAVTPISV
jgi:hypothetical protein